MAKEGKMHFVESCSFPSSSYKNVTKDAKYKSLVESAKKLHGSKTKLSESTTIIDKIKKTLTEAKVDEDMQKRVLDKLQEAGANIDDVEIWQFPVSKVNDKDHPNLNGRVYDRKLWENVIDNQTDVWKGGTGLANHPADDEDGDFMKQSIVWLDGFIGDDGVIYGIGTFVGEGGALARQIIGVGGRIGFSTSGYGDFLKDGITVDPDTYEIDRFADLVLNPSQGVYGDHSDILNKESIQNKKEGNLKESVNMKTLKEAVDIKDIVKALKAKDAVEQLSKIADDNDIEVTLNEGVAEKAIGTLTAILLANSVSDIKAEDITVDVVDDFKEVVEALKERGYSEDDAVELLKSQLKDSNISEDVIEKIFAADDEKVEEAEDDSDAEDLEEDEDLSLEEQLLVKHYTKSLKNIGKEADELWEEKIQKLNNLVEKLKESNLSDKVKAKLNTQTNSLIDSIMKEARAAIQEGFKARKICESLEIPTIAKLENIKEKLEDFTSLEECLEKATKEANKYKSLYETKTKYAVSEAEGAFAAEEKADNLSKRVINLKNSLTESKEANKNLNTKLLKTQVTNVTSIEKVNKLAEDKKNLGKRVTRLEKKNAELQDLLNEAEKTIKTLKLVNSKNKSLLADSRAKVDELNSKLYKASITEKKLKSNQEILSEKNKKMLDNISNMKREDRMQAAKKRIQENAAKRALQEKQNSFYDSDEMFKDTDNISSFLDAVGVENKKAYKGLKTMQEAENKYLFSNELLDKDAEEIRSHIRAPKETPNSLADMFN